MTDYREGRVPTVWGEFEVDCRTNSVVGVRHDLVDELTRAYTRAAPGHLQRSVFDPATRRFAAAGTAAHRGVGLEVLPATPSRLAVRWTGLRGLRLRRAAGGATLVTARATGGAWTLKLVERAAHHGDSPWRRALARWIDRATNAPSACSTAASVD